MFLFIGLGDAGCRITDSIVGSRGIIQREEKRSGIVVNVSKNFLMSLKNVPMENRVLLRYEEVEVPEFGRDRGRVVAEDQIDFVMDAIERVYTSRIQAFMMVFGLGGSFGGGAAPVLAASLRRMYGEEVPVYLLGVIPSKNEPDNLFSNASSTLRELSRYVDSGILVDNDFFLERGLGRTSFNEINEMIAKPIRMITVDDGGKEGEYSLKSAEVITVLSEGGIGTIGYYEREIKRKSGLLSVLSKKRKGLIEEDKVDLGSIVEETLRNNLYLDCDPTSASKAILVVAGPPEELRFFEGQRMLKELLGCDVVGGLRAAPRWNKVGVTILLNDVESRRVREIMEGR